MHRLLVAAVVAIGVLCASPSAASACPKCKEALAAQNDAKGLERGFKYSILFMLSAPFAILGGLGSYFWWEVQKAQRTRDAASSVPGEPSASAPDEPPASA